MGLWQRLSELVRRRPSPTGAQSADKTPATARLAVPEIDAANLRGRETPFLLLDCRETMEWKQVRIPDALHIPMNQVPSRLDELDPDADIVVYCATGARSRNVAQYLLRNGYQAENLKGGIVAWERAGYATESDYRYE